MPRPKSEPSYLLHKASGQARTIIDGKTHYLGPHGSEASFAEFNRLKAEWRLRQAEAGPALAIPAGTQVRTVEDLIFRFWPHVEAYYRHPDGTPTSEVDSFRQSFCPLRRLYKHTLVRDFGPLALKALQQAMASGSWMKSAEKTRGRRKAVPPGWSRKIVNQRIRRIVQMFAWGVSEQLVPVGIHQALKTVPGLKRGRTDAREYEDVPPVDPRLVEATLPLLGPVVRAMVLLQQLTGLRPGEVCALRPVDIDRDGVMIDGVRIWVYRPQRHKTSWRGHKKAVAIGPKAQDVLRPFLDRAPEVHCFSPAEAVEALHQERAARSRFPSRRGVNRKPKPKRRPQGRYTVTSYGRRIAKVCPRALVPGWHPPLAVGIPSWHPHQLRHLVGTIVHRDYDLDTARAVLDHQDVRTTLGYSDADLLKASRVAAKIG